MKKRICKVCKCTDANACQWWCERVKPNLCSKCKQDTIIKHPKHHHYWVDDWFLLETYKTAKWYKYREIAYTNAPNRDNITKIELRKYIVSLDPIIKDE